MAKGVMVVLARAFPGQEAELWDWYVGRHIPDLLDVPGFKRARLWRLTSRKPDPAAQYDTLAVYDLEADDLQEVLKESGARMGGPRMPKSPALDSSRTLAFTGPPELQFGEGAPQVDLEGS